MNAVLLADSGTGPRRLDLSAYLDPPLAEQSHDDTYRWIKGLRHALVDGVPLRSRFTLRGDSLWWFAELYLHKEQAILEIMRTIAAFDALIERERPLTLQLVHADRIVSQLLPRLAVSRNIRYGGARPLIARPKARILRLEARATWLTAAAWLSRIRVPRGDPAPSSPDAPHPVPIAAFVHRAFWKADVADGSAESYIGPVLRELESRVPAGGMAYVGVGPRTNFRARRWWDPFVARPGSAIASIERLSPLSRLRESREVWRGRRATLRALWGSPEIRAHAVIRGCDCWPVVREQLAGVALLQFPWSARTMDEAGAALDALRPDVSLTYAEAGGWGRALALECRRRGIPLAGLQHGFIYRHWLNYLHEPDEMQRDPINAADAGFPRPALTLLFDEFAARHLEQRGRFPREALAVTGSARLDDLLSALRVTTDDEIAVTRSQAGAAPGQHLIVFAAKYREAAGVLPALIEAVRALPDVRLAIKAHPAETADVYAAAAAGAANVSVLPASVPLSPLLAACRAVVTVNSTVAIDALVPGIPALVIGLPNNLSPFVEAGAMAGASTSAEIRTALTSILYDDGFRQQLARATGAFVAEYRLGGDGHGAVRSADAVLGLRTA